MHPPMPSASGSAVHRERRLRRGGSAGVIDIVERLARSRRVRQAIVPRMLRDELTDRSANDRAVTDRARALGSEHGCASRARVRHRCLRLPALQRAHAGRSRRHRRRRDRHAAPRRQASTSAGHGGPTASLRCVITPQGRSRRLGPPRAHVQASALRPPRTRLPTTHTAPANILAHFAKHGPGLRPTGTLVERDTLVPRESAP